MKRYLIKRRTKKISRNSRINCKIHMLFIFKYSVLKWDWNTYYGVNTGAIFNFSFNSPSFLNFTGIPFSSVVSRDQSRQRSIYSRFCYILQDICPETCGQWDCLKRAPGTRRKCSFWIASGFCIHAVYGAFARSRCSRGCCEHETRGLV